MKPEEIVRAACIAAYNMDFDTYMELKFNPDHWRGMQKDFVKWYCNLDTQNSKTFMKYVMEVHK